MKTKIYLSTLLALIIQVMVNGQTPGTPDSKTKLAPVLRHHTLDVSKKEATSTAKNTVQDVVVVQNVVTIASERTLEQQANYLLNRSQQLRDAALKTSGLEQSELMNESNQLYKEAVTLQITVLEQSGQKNKETYQLNLASINALLPKSALSAMVAKEVKHLVSDADLNMRLATEMRQEAYAMPTSTAKLGSLSNADEKEVVALGEQNQAVSILKNYAAIMAAGLDLDSYAVK